ncbi:CbrC family protein [Burkholderiaceae bacterium DAT-1]|nr:CbrC family protein [Burkholderiaceae bacterium DAT-1]
MDLPKFKYHPNPIATGAIVSTNESCECCGKARGYKYSSVLYATEEVEVICPWCISDGSAARKYDGQFLDDYPLRRGNLPESVIEEVCERTPGYNSWQQQIWQSHCGDACEFHGDASIEEVAGISGDLLAELVSREGIKAEHWPRIRDNYAPGGGISIFKFVCRHCGSPVYSLDFS